MLMSHAFIRGAAIMPVKSAMPLRRLRANQPSVTCSAVAAPVNAAAAKTAYLLVAGLATAVGGMGLLAPSTLHSALQFQFSPMTALNHSFICTVLGVTAVAALRCINAAANNRLTSDTYQRLSVAIALSSVAPLLLLLTYAPNFSALSVGSRMVSTARFTTGAAIVGIWVNQSPRPTALLNDIFAGIGDVLSPPSSLLSAFYSAITLVAGAAGLYWLKVPATAVLADTYVTKLASAHAFVFAGYLYTLKSAADRNRLGGSTFKQLNLASSAALAVIGGLVYNAVNAGTIVGSNTTTGAIAALCVSAVVCGYQGIAANDAKSSGGSSSQAAAKEYQYKTIDDPMEQLCKDDPNAEECRVFED